MGQFNGWLNSKSVWGQSFSSSACLRSMKLGRLIERAPINPLSCKWHKRNAFILPSWSGSLYNYPGDTITFTQRQENFLICKGWSGREPKIKLCRWKRKGKYSFG